MPHDKHKLQLLALEDLFKRFYKPLRAYAFKFIKDQSVAEDIVQDVFFELWSKKDTIRFDEPTSVKSYIFKSVYNRSINALNSALQYRGNALEEINESHIIEDYITTHTQNQEYSLLLKELETEINTFVETLPPQCKNIFILSRREELSNYEIAERTGISTKAVERQITKALSKIKQHLLKKDLLFIMFLFKGVL